MRVEQVWIQCQNAELYGEILIPDNIPAPGLLVCHGLDVQGYHYLKIYWQLAETAWRNGFVVLLFDFRGVGKSTGQFDYGFDEQQDVSCTLNYLALRSEVVQNRIFVVGHSLGGAVSLYALRNETRVRGLALWSIPKNHDYNVRKFIRRTRGRLGLFIFQVFSLIDKAVDVSRIFKLQVYGINLRPRFVREKLMKLNEVEAVSRLTGLPKLIVVGDRDGIVGTDEAQAIFSVAGEPKDIRIITDANHIYAGKEKELVTLTLDWIKRQVQSGTNS